MELSNANALLAERLTAAARFRAQGRLVRMLARPQRMIYPKLKQWVGGATEVAAETFWGEPLQVILPELLSVNVWRYGFFEEDVCRFLLSVLRPGMTFVDIGAHFGFFTRLGAFLVGGGGRVLSFEPIPYTFGQLEKNAGGRSNVECVNCAAFDCEKQLTLRDFGIEFSAYNSAFGMRQDVGHRRPVDREFQVTARRADDVIKERRFDAVHLIKIDAESSEMNVLQGLSETLRQHQPKVIIETGDFELEGVPKTEQIIGWLRRLGYLPYEASSDGSVRPARSAGFSYVGRNFLFTPQIGPSYV